MGSERGQFSLAAAASGVGDEEARERLKKYGPNALPEQKSTSLFLVFLRQFLNPLIYILLVAAFVSLVIGNLEDAVFIGAVLLINGIIGATQEHSADRAALALRKLEQPFATVIRGGIRQEINARELVPGDVVLLEGGVRVPADVGLVETTDLQCDESLLTGESKPVKKRAAEMQESGSGMAERPAMAFAGSVVMRGRGRGVVVATGLDTEIGKIAEQITKRSLSQPPLLIRMERFTKNIAFAVGGAIVFLVAFGLVREMALQDLFMMSIALAVSAIPEGLPIAISVALAISMRRMAKVNVIVRKMPAVESLGSCTMIATDKTGTLTMNQLTVTDICLPDGTVFICEPGQDLAACSIRGADVGPEIAAARASALLRAATLSNEGSLTRDGEGWKGIGDTVDVALLAAARKGGIEHGDVTERYPLISRIPYEPDLKYAASFHRREGKTYVFVKGAPETLIAMADRMQMEHRTAPVEHETLLSQKEQLAAQGLRVLAFAEGEITTQDGGTYGHQHLVNLTFLGMVGMQDPVRPEVPQAIRECQSAGIDVIMITGDDPKTASVIAQHAGLAFSPSQVVNGADVRRAEEAGMEALDLLTRTARIYARVEPNQKLAIVLSLARNGHYVAVTGDGVNDAPALKHAHVGVAMGRKGTEVAKESADIILTDDNFASIIAGIREGRLVYANIRKVIFMLISTGVAEVTLFILAMVLGFPMPLLAVQLLWLNLVTNGIQDVALACEKAEGQGRDQRRLHAKGVAFGDVHRVGGAAE